MDPVTHSFVGAALSRAGLRRASPLATATLILAANAPDLDALTYVGGSYASLALRRGITHGPLATLLLPGLVAAGVLAYDRWWRRRRNPDLPAARALPLLALALLGVLTHSPLDWLNTYGIRLLMPFSQQWFYGDSLFIIDPWVWLMLGAPLAAIYAGSRRGRLLWSLLAVAATGMVLAAPGVPIGARILWVVCIAAAAVWTVGRLHDSDSSGDRPVRIGLSAAAVYILLMIAADMVASRETMRAAEASGLDVRSLMVAPLAANPFAGEIVVETEEAYHLGTFDWLGRQRVQWSGRQIAKGDRDAYVLATLQVQEVRQFLRWSRFPYVETREVGDRVVIRFGDARYPAGMRGGLSGITVEVERTEQ